MVAAGVSATQKITGGTSLGSQQSADSNRDRLILRDSSSFESATSSSFALSPANENAGSASMEREKARVMWEYLSSEPELGAEKLLERQRLLQIKQSLLLESDAAKRELHLLRMQLNTLREERLHHPVVFGGAVALIGLGALWLYERKKRRLAETFSSAAWTQRAGMAADESMGEAHLPALYEADDDQWSDIRRDFQTNLPGHEEGQLAAQNSEEIFKTTPSWAVTREPEPSSERAMIEALNSKTKSGFGAWLAKFFRRAHQDKGYQLVPEQIQVSVQDQFNTEPASTLIYAHVEDGEYLNQNKNQALDSKGGMRVPQMLEQGAPYAQYRAEQHGRGASAGNGALERLLELRTMVNGLRALDKSNDAAILLKAHLQDEPGTCAWAYLEYMRLCEELDRVDDFEAVRSLYRKEFNRMAPNWQEPNAHVLGLDGYSRATAELCTAWTRGPQHTRRVLHDWLLGPLVGRKLVQLPAFHDLFDLYELLELAGQTEPDEDQLRREVTANSDFNEELKDSSSEQDFVPTVSLLDLDFEFSSDVTIDKSQAEMAEKAVTALKPGEFSLDFNVAGAQSIERSATPVNPNQQK